MSLQGSFETFALPDVLLLLSSTKKTGELRVVGGGQGVDGCLWVANGLLVRSDVGHSRTHADAVFELLRAGEGDFTFESDAVAPGGPKGVKIEPVLAEAQARMVEWQEIERFVPSMAASLTLAPEAPGPEVTVTADQWRVLANAGCTADVAGLVDAIGGSEFDTCRTVKELVEAGLMRVEGRAPRPPEAVVVVADPPAPLEVPEVPEISASAPATIDARADQVEALLDAAAGVGDDDEDDGDEPINRGLLLKFLSSVRS